MCFRPPTFDDMMKKCPTCGAFNAPDLLKCKKCGADLPEAAADPGNLPPASAPGAPGAPKGPGAPGAPKGPGGPGAPKGPGGPGGPGAPKGPGMPPRGPGAPPSTTT
jgi:hypothetical protein